MLIKQLLKPAVALLALVAIGLPSAATAKTPLDPTTIPQFVTPLVIPPAMPRTDKLPAKMAKSTDYYEIAVRQFDQQILPTPLPPTTVWGYGSVNHPGTFNYPAYTIEAKYSKPVQVKWINDLKNPSTGEFLPHLLPIDPTLHWADPGNFMCNMPEPDWTCANHPECCTSYTGPVPIITHLHGAHVGPDSDGYPDAWYLPAATNLEGYTTQGSLFDQIPGVPQVPGEAVFQYPNDQRATTLWFHDHTLGMTRANVYAGPVGFYLLRGGPDDRVINAKTGKPAVLPGPAPALGDLPGMKYYEIPLVIQDKSFNADGSLFFPDNRAFFEGLEKSQLQIPFTPDPAIDGGTSDVSPIWNPEFFGNTMVVNGKTWPIFDVEPRQYRFRILNGSDSRFLTLTTGWPGASILTFNQIGADGGFLPAPVPLTELLVGPAERADVIVDFSAFAGQTITLQNIGPDEPFGGGAPCPPGQNPDDNPGCGDFAASDPDTTGQVMQFRVAAKQVKDPSTPAANLLLPARTPLGPAVNAADPRKLSLNEEESSTVFVPVDPVTGEYILDAQGNLVAVSETAENAAPFGPTEALLGIIAPDDVTYPGFMTGDPVPLEWMQPITENPVLNTTEVWEIYNFTMDAHPIHIHLVQFEILSRETLAVNGEGMTTSTPTGDWRGPEPWETGTKDTIIVYPGEVARVKAKFDIAGLFVWHCHILSHEDNEMMRPYEVVPPMAP